LVENPWRLSKVVHLVAEATGLADLTSLGDDSVVRNRRAQAREWKRESGEKSCVDVADDEESPGRGSRLEMVYCITLSPRLYRQV
jgi:hypothetical protein